MSDIDYPALERAVRRLLVASKGPGGAVGVVHDGGGRPGARLGIRRPRAPPTDDDADAAADLLDQQAVHLRRAARPRRRPVAPRRPGGRRSCRGSRDRRPSVAELCHKQSGLRDYWALTVLHGAHPEGVFAREDARPLLARMRTTHFAPGTSYSYSQRQLPHALRPDRGACRAQPRRALRRDGCSGRPGWRRRC